MTARQKIANFTRSKLGAFVLYGSALTIPAIGAGIIYDANTMDMDNSTNPTSQQAASDYLTQYKPLTALYDDISTLRNSAELQQGAENILSVKEKMRSMEGELRQEWQNLSVNIINDERLTETDYKKVANTIYRTSRFDSYMSPELSREANALFESRAVATGDTPLAKAMDITNKMENEDNFKLKFFGLISMLFLYAGLGAGMLTAEASGTREKLSNKIKKGGKHKSNH